MTVTEYEELLYAITPRYLGAVFARADCPVPLAGESIARHLGDCGKVLISAATLGEEFDRLLRKTQVTDMAGAVILDSLAGGYIERFCNEKDRELSEIGRAFRFSPGYGDFPLSINRDILNVLDAPKKIGLCVTDVFILTPQKSITGVTPL